MSSKPQEQYGPKFANKILGLDLSPNALEEVVLGVAKENEIEEIRAELEARTYRSNEDLSDALKRVCVKRPVKWKKYAKKTVGYAAKAVVSLAVVSALGYGVSRIPSVRQLYDEEYVAEKELERKKERNAQIAHREWEMKLYEADHKARVARMELRDQEVKLYESLKMNCSIPSITDFTDVYLKTTGKKINDPQECPGGGKTIASVRIVEGIEAVGISCDSAGYGGEFNLIVTIPSEIAPKITEKAREMNPCYYKSE